jgi:hypothetical protein
MIYNLSLSFGLAITCTVISLILLSWIVDLFRLNYRGSTYWAFNVCFVVFWLSFMLSFTRLMAPIIIEPEPTKPIVKLSKTYREPLHYVSSKVNGNVESIHIWGRTEVVPVTTIQLTRYFYEDNLWVLEEPQTGGIIQPEGRKGYFMPVMSGTLNTQYGSAQLTEVSNVGWEDEKDEYWSEFRVANIIFKNEEPVSVHYQHYNYDYKDNLWKEIAGYQAVFKETKK